MPCLLPYFISYRSSCHKDQKTAIQLPVSSDGYGDIKIHLAEISEEKTFLSISYPFTQKCREHN